MEISSCCGSLSGFYAEERECVVTERLIYSFALAEFSRLESGLNHCCVEHRWIKYMRFRLVFKKFCVHFRPLFRPVEYKDDKK